MSVFVVVTSQKSEKLNLQDISTRCLLGLLLIKTFKELPVLFHRGQPFSACIPLDVIVTCIPNTASTTKFLYIRSASDKVWHDELFHNSLGLSE